MDKAQVASRLRSELGWYAWANGIERGHANQAALADALSGAIAEKENWLSRHTFKAGSEGEGRHHTMTTWCERARSLVVEMQGATQEEGA